MEQNNKLNQLSEQLESLVKRQESFIKEIVGLRKEIRELQKSEPEKTTETFEQTKETVDTEKNEQIKEIQESNTIKPRKPKPPIFKKPKFNKKSNIEKFIGENLISKLGIIIIVIGVALGAKYAMDKEMLGPLARTVMAYFFGLALLAVAIKLKAKYETYSAVLLSGAMAILYFVTYAAYSYYEFIPQIITFALMLIFTAFTVFAALSYDKQIIAHFGLVGAYTIPFLLSDGSGKVAVLFSYMAIINFGILVLSFKKYWKPLYYSSFSISWLIFIAWLVNMYDEDIHFRLAFIFISIFFAIFYISFLTYKLIKKEQFDIGDILLLLSNAFIFYGIGYGLLNEIEGGEPFLGMFTLINAIVHFGVSMLIFKQKLTDKNLFYFVLGLVLVFITIAIPVQLEGRWVTMIWAGETALMFWIGRSKKIAMYEQIAYPLAYLAFISLIHDWALVYDNFDADYPETFVPLFFNVYFLTSLFVAAAYGFQIYLKTKYTATFTIKNKFFNGIQKHSFTALILIVLYFTFHVEIINYWEQLFENSRIATEYGDEYYQDYDYNYDLKKFQALWILNFNLIFFTILSFLNSFAFKNKALAKFNIITNAIVLLVFLSQGLLILSELREIYLEPDLEGYFQAGIFYLNIRYISVGLLGLLLASSYLLIKSKFLSAKKALATGFEIVLHGAILWILSSELLHWLDIYEAQNSYKLGLSILWGVYSLLLIILGISRNKKPIRIMAISIFGFTLIKLFVYDISHLNMLHKTIIFMSLGILLLIISFLYTKYKHLIFDDDDETEKE